MSKKQFSISGNLLLISFLLCSLLLVGVIGLWMFNNMTKIQLTTQQSNYEAASLEVRQAISRTLISINDQLIKIENWNEIYQQLNNPVYYDYWRNNRSLGAGILSNYVKGIELYNSQGLTLGKSEIKDTFPDKIPPGLTYMTKVKDKLHFHQFTPLHDQGSNKLKGYAGISVDFMDAFFLLNSFRYTDLESIHFEIDETISNPEEQLANGLRFKELPITALGQLEDVMLETLLRIIFLLILLGIIAYYIVYRFFQKPLYRLSQHIDTFRKGKVDDIKPKEDITGSLIIREIDALFSSFQNYQYDLDTMHASLNQKNTELWRLAHHDPLTSVPNRRAYEEDWKQMLSLIQGQSISISVMLIDCDHFKAINDTYGHSTGDSVIKAVAECLQSCLRKNDRLYRLGGDEFAIHVINATVYEAENLATCCQEAVNSYSFKKLGVKEPVRFSIGIAHASGSTAKDLNDLHKQADIAMYHAKGPGINKIVHYQPELEISASAVISSRYLQAVYDALENGHGIKLHYQPVISFQSANECFCEVLTRLEDSEGLIMPAHIFPVVNAEGLEVEFDIAILKHLKSQLETKAIPQHARLSVNLGGTSLTAPPVHEALQELRQFLENYSIILEVTETALITELHKATDILTELRNDGFQVALDDFGSGYSSLRYLASMPVDIVKFDISMVRALDSNDTQRQIAIDVARMILSAGYDLVAEGIEDEAMLNKVRMLGFTHVQGFLLARPSAQINLADSYNINLRSGSI